MQLIISEEIFNSLFMGKEITIESLFNLAKKNKVLDTEYLDEVLTNYQNSIVQYIFNTNVFSDDDSIDIILKDESKRIIDAINEYISSYSPYNAMELLLNTDIFSLINESLKNMTFKQSELLSKYNKLCRDAQYLINNSLNFKYLMDFLLSSINKEVSSYYYYLLNGKSVSDYKTLDDLSSIMDDLAIEASILSHFNPKDIIHLLKNGDYAMVSSHNITEMVLCNYIFNYFYKECISLLITDSMADTIIKDINLKTFAIDDIVEIIEIGGIEFSKEEKDYILSNFIKSFEKEVILNKRIDCFIKN